MRFIYPLSLLIEVFLAIGSVVWKRTPLGVLVVIKVEFVVYDDDLRAVCCGSGDVTGAGGGSYSSSLSREMD